jgi:hypothetical protein
MWDSNTATAHTVKVHGKGGPDASDTAHAGAAAHVAPIRSSVSSSALTLMPSRAMLSGKHTVWPVYIDPTFNWHPTSANSPAFDELKQGSPCNGESLYNSTSAKGDYGHLGVGVNAWDGCLGIMRAYYQWSIPKVIWGAHINTATVEATEIYAAYCTSTATINLLDTGAIGSKTSWNNRPGYWSFHTSASFGPTYNPTYCPNGESVSHGFNVQAAVVKAAAGHWSHLTAALAEDSDESSHSSAGFRRFTDNPTLQIFYNRTPHTVAASTSLATVGADKAACDSSAPFPYIGKTIATNTPVLSAKISDPDGDKLQATFHYWLKVDGTTVHSGTSGDNLASGSTAKFTIPTSFIDSLTNGDTVGWHVQVTDGQATSGWSPSCYFTVEPDAPGAPTITPETGSDGTVPYPDTDNGGGTGAAAGTQATFEVANTQAGTTATAFIYHLDTPPTAVNTPSYEKVTASNNAASLTIDPYAPGPHTLWVGALDAAGDASGMTAYQFEADHDANTTCSSLSACYNNTAISPDSDPTKAAADGSSSYSATDLSNAGWSSGGTVAVDGAPFHLPSFGAGQADNVLAANQTVTYNYPVPTGGPTALVMLASSTHATVADPGAIDNDTTAPYVPAGIAVSGTYCFDTTDPSAYCPAAGTITYTDGTTQPYFLTVPDWVTGPASLAAVVLPHENKPSGQTATSLKIYPFSIPLTAGKTVASVTLPDVGNNAGNSTQALHIFGMAPRNTTTATVTPTGTSTAAPSGQSWTGTWGSPTEGNYNYQGGNFSNQTFRVDLRPSTGGNTVRIKLDNALGTSKLSIGHATIATSPGPSWAVPDATPTALTFGGSTSVTIPAGGMVYSDPLPFTVDPSKYLLVSYQLANTVPYLVQHSWTITQDAHQFVTATGSGDHTADTTDTAFTATGAFNGDFTDLLTDVDVATAGTGTQAVLGDGLIDAWQPNSLVDGSTGLADDLAAAAPTTPTGYGTVSEGIEANQIATDYPESSASGLDVGGPAALARIDRDILDQPGLTTVVLDEGLEDILNGHDGDDLTGNGYTELLQYLQANGINIIAVGLTPCTGYTGDGATGNSTNDPCTTEVDSARTAVNNWLANNPLNMNPWTSPALYYIDSDSTIGITDSTTGAVSLDAHADNSDHVNLTNPGYAALTTAYLAARDTWPLNDGAGTTVSDTASSFTNPYVANDPSAGTNPATLAGGATWTSDTTRGNALTLDGTTGYAATSGPVIDTTRSFSVSTWVDLASTPATNATIAGQDGTAVSGFFLQYNHTHTGNPGWAFNIPDSDTASPTWHTAYADGATTGWTHLVGVYNATAHTASLYVNGTLADTATGVTTINATGPFTLGRGQYNAAPSDYLPGTISTTHTFNYALTPYQVTALYQQIA